MVPLGELCEINVGRTPSRDNAAFWGDGEPWLSIADMNQGLLIQRTKEQITRIAANRGNQVAPGTVLLSFKLSIGKVAIAGVPLYTNEAIAALPIKDAGRLSPRFLLRALEAMDLSSGANRAAMGATLNKAKLQQLYIPLLPLPEQRRIAAILDHADTLRAKRRQAISYLDDLKQSIFLDMFGPPATWPDRWVMGKIGDMVDDVQYGTSGKAGQSGSWPIVRMGNVTDDGRLDLDDIKWIDLADRDIPKFTVRRGDLLFNRTNSTEKVGKTCVVETDQALAFAGYLVRVRLTKEHRPEFVNAYLTSRYGQALRRSMAKAAVNQANINAREMQSIPIALPPQEVQREFAAALSRIHREQEQQLAASGVLDELFASLQSRAFRGEL